MAELWFVMFALLCVSLFGGGLRVWWVWGQRWRQGEPPLAKRFRRDTVDVPIGAVVLTLAWLMVHLLLKLIPSGDADPPGAFDADRVMLAGKAAIAEGLFISAVAAALLLIPLRRTDCARLGFHFEQGGEQIREGAVGMAAAFVPVYLVMLASIPLRDEDSLHPLLRLLSERGFGLEMAWIPVLAVIIAPLKEELLFRVILQSWLSRVLNRTAALWVTAVLFAAVHEFPDALGIFPLALVLGYVYQQRRSFLAIFTLHALFNAFNLLAMTIQPYLNELMEQAP